MYRYILGLMNQWDYRGPYGGDVAAGKASASP
jgi:hypothetical protein